MKRILLCCFLTLSSAAMAQNTAAPAGADPLTAIAKLREGLSESFKKGDVEGILTYLDPDVVVTWQNAELCRGPEQIRAFYHRMMSGDKKIVREIKSEPEVIGRQVNGDWAVSWGNLHDHFILMDGSDLPLNSVFTATIAKRGDRWLVTAFHASVNAFENPILGLALGKASLWSGLSGLGLGLFLGLLAARFFRKKNATA